MRTKGPPTVDFWMIIVFIKFARRKHSPEALQEISEQEGVRKTEDRNRNQPSCVIMHGIERKSSTEYYGNR